MAKVSTAHFKIDGKDVYIPVYYTTKKGFHFQDFPAHVYVFADFKDYFQTENELIHFYQNTIKTYADATRTSKLMIRIKLRLSTEYIMNEVAPGQWQGFKYGLSTQVAAKFKSDFSSTNGIDFHYEVVRIINSNGEMMYSVDANKNALHEIRSGIERELLIPYSEESEMFLKSVKDALHNLVGGLVKFFSSENLEQKILETSGKFLLSNNIEPNQGK
jgi:hypothetical protein